MGHKVGLLLTSGGCRREICSLEFDTCLIVLLRDGCVGVVSTIEDIGWHGELILRSSSSCYL